MSEGASAISEEDVRRMAVHLAARALDGALIDSDFADRFEDEELADDVIREIRAIVDRLDRKGVPPVKVPGAGYRGFTGDRRASRQDTER